MFCLQWRIQDFLEGGAPIPGGGGRQNAIWPIFPENCMKMKKNWPRGGGGRPLRFPLDPPMACKLINYVTLYLKKISLTNLEADELTVWLTDPW